MIQGRIGLSRCMTLFCVFSVSALFSITTTGSPVGASLVGDVGVGVDGSAIYNISLITPPGIIKPPLSINYSSQSGNGRVGIGWSLGGLSQISRCPRTKEVDGVEDGIIRLTDSDRLCLNGERLILKSGSAYGAAGAEYSTRIESFTKVVGYGDYGSESSWFKVWKKNGEILELGNSSDSRVTIKPVGKVAIPYVWSVSKVVDRFSNYYEANYFQDSGVNYLKSIKYSGNVNSGSLPAREVSFDWGASVRPDPIFIYVGGGAQATIRYRLQGINNDANGARYKFSYKLSEASASNLEKLQYCVDGIDENCISVDAQYGYEKNPVNGKRMSDPQLVLSQFGTAQGWTDFNVNPRTLGDVNGDGLLDIVGFGSDGVYVSFASSTGFFPAVKKLEAFGVTAGGWTDNKKFPRIVADINGDGLADIVGFASAGVTVALSDGQGFTQPAIWIAGFGAVSGWTEQGTFYRDMVDVNGDGLLDVVGINTAGQVYVSINNKTSFTAPILNTTLIPATAGQTLSEKKTPIQIIDVNSDGKADIAVWIPIFGGVFFPRISYGTEAGFSSEVTWTWSDTSSLDPNAPVEYPPFVLGRTALDWDSTAVSMRTLVDINGDGIVDLLGFTTASYSDDSGCWFGCANPQAAMKYYRKSSLDMWISYGLGNGLFTIEKKIRDGGAYVLDKNYEYNSSVMLSPYEFSDAGGDSRKDLITYSGSCAYISVAAKEGFLPDECLVQGFTPQVGGWDTQKHRKFAADINGDGVPDILGFGTSGTFVSYGSAKSPQQLISLKNGLLESIITYGSLVDPKVYQKGIGSQFPIMEVQAPSRVVTGLSSLDGLGGKRTTNYRYGGLRFDLVRGSLGFQWQETMDTASGLLNFTEYKQDFPYIGSTSKSQNQHCASVAQIPWTNCTVLSQEESNWNYRSSGDSADRKVYMPFIQSTQESSWAKTSP